MQIIETAKTIIFSDASASFINKINMPIGLEVIIITNFENDEALNIPFTVKRIHIVDPDENALKNLKIPFGCVVSSSESCEFNELMKKKTIELVLNGLDKNIFENTIGIHGITINKTTFYLDIIQIKYLTKQDKIKIIYQD